MGEASLSKDMMNSARAVSAVVLFRLYSRFESTCSRSLKNKYSVPPSPPFARSNSLKQVNCRVSEGRDGDWSRQ